VEKFILVDAFFGAAEITEFHQYFSQERVVPVPGTLALFALGLIGLGWRRRA
jgi:hypothetical protein